MLGPVRLVVLDSIRPGRERGELDADRLAWLDAELQEEPDVPTLLALHHPPVEIGLEALDCIGIPAEGRAGLADVVRRHPQVRRIVAGHAHRVIVSELEGRAVLVAPSTFAQARLSFSSDTIEFTSEPTGFAVHILCDGEIVSHVQGVAPPS